MIKSLAETDVLTVVLLLVVLQLAGVDVLGFAYGLVDWPTWSDFLPDLW